MIIRRASSRLVLLTAIVLLFSQCAVLSKDNRYLTAALDEDQVPESQTMRTLFYPLAVPTGLVAMLIDGILIHPLVSLPRAADDATFVFTEIDYMGVLEIIAFPMRLITYPVVLAGDWIFRITVPVDL